MIRSQRHGASGRKPFAHAGARRQDPPDRDFDLKHIRLEIGFDLAARRIRGRTTQTFAPLRAEARSLVLDALELTIESVSGEHDKPLAFAHAGGKLRIELPRAYAEGEAFDVAIVYHGSPRAGLWFIGPDEGYPDKPPHLWTQGEQEDTRLWLPTWDYPNDRATSEVLATVPASWVALSNGELVEVREEAGGKTFHWRQDRDHVPYLITLVAGEFDVLEARSASGVPLHYYLPKGRGAQAERALGRTPAMLDFFEQWTGMRYPWAKYAQAVVYDFTFGGMENTSATTLTDRALHDERATPDFSADWLVMHELAHQWFGDLVTCRGWEHLWLNEGFATYSEILWREHALGQDEADHARLEKADRYLGEDRDSYRRPICQNVFTESGELFDRHAYEKASLVLHMLRRLVGERGFQRGVQAYLRDFQFRLAETADLRRALEDATGRSLDWFFEAWLEGAGHPELEVSTRFDERAGQCEVRLRQVQERGDGLTPLFRLPLAIRLWDGEGHRDFPVELDRADQSFHFPAAAAPLAVGIDPGNHQLKTLAFERSVEALAVELKRAPLAVDRSLAARALGQMAHPAATALLVEAARGDAFWGVRKEALRALGKSKAEGALAALVAGLADPDSRVRAAAAEGLGELKDPAGLEHLRRFLAAEEKDYPRAEAVKALGTIGGEGVLADLERALALDSHQDIIRQRVFDGLAERSEEPGCALALEWSVYGKPPKAREAAIKALGKLGKLGGRQQEVRERLEALASRDRYIWARRAAIEALGELGDDKAVAALERAGRGERDARLTRAAREAVARLRSRPGDEAALRREMDELREQHRKLESLVQGLKARLDPPRS